MKKPCLRWLVCLLLTGLLAGGVMGCGSKENEEASAPPPAAAAAEGEAPAEEVASATEESTTDALAIDMSQPASPADYDSAVQQKDFVRAADVVLRMNAQSVQGANTLNRMRELQDEVARAAANGDPKARQAAEMLRRIGRMPPTAASAQ
jgi:hypothetical protein